MLQNAPTDSSTFIVIQPNPIVSLDLSGMLESAFPSSSVYVFQKLDEASEQIRSALKSACILIDSDLLNATSVVNIENIVARGTRVVVVGAADGVSFAATVVNMPFTTEMVLSALG